MAKAQVDENGSDIQVEPAVEQEPQRVGRGQTLIRTRAGHEFNSGIADVPAVTHAGLYVSRELAEEIVALADTAGGVGYVTIVDATDDDA